MSINKYIICLYSDKCFAQKWANKGYLFPSCMWFCVEGCLSFHESIGRPLFVHGIILAPF